MSTYVWCEDSGSGFIFWKKVFDVLYDDFIVETKKNNSELCKAVSKIVDDDNNYYILMDYAIDNPNVLRETQRLFSLITNKNNVSVIKIHSFEFVLLSFKFLTEWIFAEHDELKEKRMKLIDFKDKLVNLINNGGDDNAVRSLKESYDFSDTMNLEQLSAKVLFDITRNTGFETSKGKIGECFIVDCCEWTDREDDDICGLNTERITGEAKIKSIFEQSVLKESFTKVGL